MCYRHRITVLAAAYTRHPWSNISPNTVLISAGVDSCYGHPDASAVKVYQSIAKHVFATNVDDGVCLLTCRVGDDYLTQLGSHVAAA